MNIDSHDDFEEWCGENGGDYDFQEVDDSSMCEFGNGEWVEWGDIHIVEGDEEVRVLTNPTEQMWWWGLSEEEEEIADGTVEVEDLTFHETSQEAFVVGSAGTNEESMWSLEDALSEVNFQGYRVTHNGTRHRPVGGAQKIPRTTEPSSTLSQDGDEWIHT